MTAVDKVTGEVITVGSATPVWEAIQAAPDRAAKVAAARDAMVLMDMPGCDRPVPKLFVDLPWVDSDEAQAEILARVIAAESLTEALGGEDDLPDMDTYVGRQITLWGVTARKGDIEEGWGAYITLDITVAGEDGHRVVNTSAAEIVVDAWRAHCEGLFPFTAQVILKGKPTKGRSQPIGLAVESKF